MMCWEDFAVGSARDLGEHTVRWLQPVRAGDTIAYRVIVAEARPSASRSGVGLVKHRWEARNQAGELALTLEGWILVRRRAR